MELELKETSDFLFHSVPRIFVWNIWMKGDSKLKITFKIEKMSAENSKFGHIWTGSLITYKTFCICVSGISIH
jgi:hypothetical protein